MQNLTSSLSPHLLFQERLPSLSSQIGHHIDCIMVNGWKSQVLHLLGALVRCPIHIRLQLVIGAQLGQTSIIVEVVPMLW